MKSNKRESRKTSAAAPAGPRHPWRPYGLGCLSAVVLAFWAYSPALHGPFLFDDTFLPFARAHARASVIAWMRGVRPVLMATYWANFTLSGEDTYSYHVVNVVIHLATSGLMLLLVRRFLKWAGEQAPRRDLLAGFAAFVFLLHPAQTEAVAYLAGRSESLSVMFFFLAFTIFVLRPQPVISWPVMIAVLASVGLAFLSKEHTIVFPALLLLTDYYWNPGFKREGMLRNWKVYAPLAVGGLAGAYYFRGLLLYAPTAGFGFKEFTWYQYFFTECRALFVYLRLFVLPVGLNVDYDFAISRSVLEHGAIFGLIVLAALAGAAWFYRRRYPLASYGFLAFLLLMAPTSSILPIKDPVAERRLYLAVFGLLLVVVDVLRRLRLNPRVVATAMGAILLLFAGLTYARSNVWSDGVTFWEDTAGKSPDKFRVRFQLASAYFEAGRCDAAAQEFGNAARLGPPNHNLLVDWALAYDCLNRPDDALAKLRQAAMLEPTAHVYSQIGMIYAKRARWAEATEALTMAQKIDEDFPATYVYMGGVHLSTGDAAAAIADYRRALQLDRSNPQAQEGLAMALRQQRGGR